MRPRLLTPVVLIFSLTVSNMGLSEEWKPRKGESPTAVLNSAGNDTQAGRYEEALIKFAWYFENAAKIEPSLSGVRVSFALSDWMRLCEKYPPAMQKLESVRDEAARRVLKGEEVYDSFHDMRAINRKLKDDPLTRDIFLELDQNDPKSAASVFSLAKDALIRSREFGMLAKYVNPKKDFRRLQRSLEDANGRGDGRSDESLKKFMRKRYANDVATLVAILSIAGRDEEAKSMTEQARKDLDDPDFHDSLNEALQGVLPEPWP